MRRAALLPVALVAQNADLHVMPIRGNVFMIVGGGSNVTVSAGADGILLVDAGSAAMADKMLATITEIDRATSEPGRLTTCVGPSCYQSGSLGPFTAFGWAGPSYNAVIASPKAPKPIRWILQTTVDAGAHGRHGEDRARGQDATTAGRPGVSSATSRPRPSSATRTS